MLCIKKLHLLILPDISSKPTSQNISVGFSPTEDSPLPPQKTKLKEETQTGHKKVEIETCLHISL